MYLHITAKSSNGFHTIESLIAFADIGDELTVGPSSGLYLNTNGPFSQDLCSNESNLVIKAAKALAKFYAITPEAIITLTKNLPVSSGIGGGSTDAASVLYALSTLWKLPTNSNKLHKIAKKLGADVPVCLIRSPSIVRGIGEKISPFYGLPEMWCVLANPGKPVSTQDVFAAYTEKFSEPRSIKQRFTTVREFINYLSNFNNDLTKAAIQISPVISTVLKEMSSKKNQLLTRLSGSGATCYALFEDKMSAASAANELKLKYPEWWVQVARIESNAQ